MLKYINKPIIFEPYGQPPDSSKPWGAISFDGETYWVNDNGFWEEDPSQSEPTEEQETIANYQESRKIAELLNDEVRILLRENGYDV